MQALEVLGRTPLVHELRAPPSTRERPCSVASRWRWRVRRRARRGAPATPLPPVRAHTGVRGYGCAMAVCAMYPLLSTTFGLAGDPVY